MDLERAGPGLLLRDIRAGKDPQILAVRRMIEALRADVLFLTGVDYDADLLAARALAGDLYPHLLALRPNAGRPTGIDLDGDGRLGGPGDAQGWGRFGGQGGMVLLSRLPLGPPRDFSDLLWADLPEANLPPMPPEARAVQRLASVGAWEVPLPRTGGPALKLLLWSATPPVFDGPEDRNGRRAGDEALFWARLLDGRLPFPAPEGPVLLMGKANIDPLAGDGPRAAIAALLAHPALQDPAPRGPDGSRATADFRADDGPGLLRTDYILPARGLPVTASGVLWPPPGDPLAAVAAQASRHRPVWVELDLP
ncbi:Endonuclease/Exonuclease/phosphatase family protein [[Luteovulum] sphaeroides subsp. megalophilum]|uniref:endonuclease/exonuclease/phosphatase family protein n=1 Tax=Cereibacter sphaeroides TaxID=1063 RepID=UPI000B68CB4D|nr:endonuclease/exonuclease/phosphatase family protein [Cereibacter sphaeroides]AZB62717.1 endonuclease/exonuclease/phosphatase family protein [Cereibacter sphaeroides]AZB69328.1 endonuclease/exonuclease/phosphatase family protein [Cereibacter sphaeroides]SNS57355.1 Endonuclease/Exonuclease/phosphatase family protein [[Luteovulum] sphaeroides subsp. megalophilum]